MTRAQGDFVISALWVIACFTALEHNPVAALIFAAAGAVYGISGLVRTVGEGA